MILRKKKRTVTRYQPETLPAKKSSIKYWISVWWAIGELVRSIEMRYDAKNTYYDRCL